MRLAGFLILALFVPFSAHAALVNINTADAELLDTLPGIGPSKAQAIITYRTEHGPFARIEDIQNVSGIGPSTYADIQPLITVGDTAPTESAGTNPPDQPATSASATTAATAVPPASGAPPEYIPVPTLRISALGDRSVSSGADVAFTAVVYDGKGNRRDDALVTWSFGDGTRKIGASVFHSYYNPGEYLAVAHASTPDGGDAIVEYVVTVRNANVHISSISARGVSLTNSDSRILDLSLWRLFMGGKEFKIPEDTQILAGRTVLFSAQVTGLPLSDSALLLYPSGDVAALYPKALALSGGTALQEGQLSADGARYGEQATGSAGYDTAPLTSVKISIQTHEEGVKAPTAATELAAVGAASSSPSSSSAARILDVFKSPWTLGFLGVLVLAGAAFIFL